MHVKPNAVASGVALALSMTVQIAQAQEQLDDVQVTANRLPQSQADVLASTTIIDRDEIERSQADDLIELLQGRAGIEIAQNGAPGTTSSVFLRGTNSNHTLVLVDGVRINSASSSNGATSLEFLTPEMIERVEIVRGPRAAAYGSDAIGGVIQIFTRSGGEGTHGDLNLRAGEDGFAKQSAHVSTGNADTRVNATLFHRDGDGFNATEADLSGEDDGFESTGGQLGIAHRFSDRVSGSLRALRQDFNSDYDSYGASDYTSDGYQQNVSGNLDVALKPDWNMRLTAGHFDERRDDRQAGERETMTKTQRDELGLQHTFTHDDGLESLGVDYRHDSIDYDSIWDTVDRDSRDNVGVYGLVQRQYGRHQLSGSLRYDDDSLFGDETTGNIAYAYHLTAYQQIGASYGTAYKAPTLYQLYSAYGNRDLDAETSKNTELFWRYDRSGWNASVSVFENRIDDLLNTELGASGRYQYYNVDEARIRGVELSGGWQQGGLSLKASVTRQDPENRETGDQLARRAELYGRLDADYRYETIGIGMTLRASRERPDSDYSDVDVAGYGVVDLRTAWQVTPEIELSAKLENAFDKEYQLADGYNTQDRYLEAGVRLRF
ncbi:TonB-dependent receptor domain-containing protein [Salinicola avicenniae]|uniref:TonB-dependent receptor domain-containing protein n=1 Tax=Salinicola avicenniae TaxID=2916836 RepID=UPI0020736F82|nr:MULTISPECIES: TonB-dependent receptor [unclassified Salinicola]